MMASPPPGRDFFPWPDSERRAPLGDRGILFGFLVKIARVIGLVSANGGGGGRQVTPGLAKQNVESLRAACSDWWKTSGATCPEPLRHGR